MSPRSNQGWRGPCEAGTAINDRFGAPLVEHCNEPGLWFEGGLFGFVLCPEHEHLKERWGELAMHVRDQRIQKRRSQGGTAAS